MKNQWRRLVTAALISSSVFAANWYWYHSNSQKKSNGENEELLAYVGKAVDDIQRRPASRLLWQSVNTGEPLYNGEAIRTSEAGEVRIQFANSDRYIDLEPESLIVIKKSDGEITLDLMEGSLFVNAKNGSGESAAPDLVLNSAKGKIDLSGATASLSLNNSKDVDLRILEGKASIKNQEGQTKELPTNSGLRILSPAPQKPIAMSAENPEPLPFSWQGFPPNTQVSLWVGPSRKQLKEVAKASGGDSKIVARLPFGKHYWKLVATSATGSTVAESAIFKSEIVPRYAATVTFPTADLEIPSTSLPYDMNFKWQKADDTKSLSLEIWKDPALKQRILTKTFTTEEGYVVPGLEAGTYYWRLSSFFVDTNKPHLGKIQKFIVTEPGHLAKVSPLEVKFTMSEADLTQYYVENPQIGFSWQTDRAQQVARWRVKLLDENGTLATPDPLEVQTTKFAHPVAKPGRYIASIEALDDKGKILGHSTSQPITVSPLPLLKAPQLKAADAVIQASLEGDAQLQWTQISGAQQYWVSISQNGQTVKKSKYTGTSALLKNLLPGEYEVIITAIDAHGRSGEPGAPRKISVPEKSNVKAPTLKKIKVN